MMVYFSRLYIILLMIGLPLCYAADLKKIEQSLSDTLITTKVTAKLTHEKLINPLKVKVSTKQSVVRLNGHVKDKATVLQILRIVQKSRGVKAVNIQKLDALATNTLFADAYITTKVESAILMAKIFADPSIPLVGINTKTINGVTSISGEVKSQKSMLSILNYINGIKGIKKVNNQLKVSSLQT